MLTCNSAQSKQKQAFSHRGGTKKKRDKKEYLEPGHSTIIVNQRSIALCRILVHMYVQGHISWSCDTTTFGTSGMETRRGKILLPIGET